MLKYIVFAFVIFINTALFAETIKTDVLVIGGTYSGTAASLQCARSKVKTILIVPGRQLINAAAAISLTKNKTLTSGIWGEFQKHLQACNTAHKITAVNQQQVSYTTALAVLKIMTDTVKKLTVQLNTQWLTIKKSGTGWEVNVLNNGKPLYIKTKLLIDATETGKAALAAGAVFITDADHRDSTGRQLLGLVHTGIDDVYQPYTHSQLYRTSIAVNNGSVNTGRPLPAFVIPLGAVIAKNVNNLLVTGPVISAAYQVNRALDNPAAQLLLGQGAGTIAAYCAFFETTTQNLNVRMIQGELLDHKGVLLPFADIASTDADWRATQQVAATGLLQGERSADGRAAILNFMPDVAVNTAEIKPVLLETYTRSFLWFNRIKPVEQFTVGNLLSLISEFTLTAPDVLQAKLQRQWQLTYHFKQAFDLNRPVTRREFAVLVNQYLNPFARRVDLEGHIVN